MKKVLSIAGLLVCAVMTLVMGRLGIWQLERAADKASIVAEYEKTVAKPPLSVSVSELSALPSYTRVRLSGRLLEQQHVLVEEQYVNTRPGARVLSLLQAEQGLDSVFVFRGWVPEVGNQAFEGELDAMPERLDQALFMVLGYDQLFRPSLAAGSERSLKEAVWPKRVLALSYTELEKSTNFPLQSVVLKPLTQGDWVFYDDWQPVTLGVYRHYGYAAQWFLLALAFFLLLGFLAYRITVAPRQ